MFKKNKKKTAVFPLRSRRKNIAVLFLKGTPDVMQTPCDLTTVDPGAGP